MTMSSYILFFLTILSTKSSLPWQPTSNGCKLALYLDFYFFLPAFKKKFYTWNKFWRTWTSNEEDDNAVKSFIPDLLHN